VMWIANANIFLDKLLPDVHPSAWMPFLLPWRTL